MRTTTVAGSRGVLAATATSGLALFVLGLASPPEGPQIGGASAREVRRFVEGSDVALRVAAATGTLTVVAVLVFTASLATLVRRAAPESLLAPLVAGTGVVIATVQLLSTAAVAMLRLLPELVGTHLADVPDADVRTWYGQVAFTHFVGDLLMGPLALLLLAASVAALRLGALPRWLGWTALVLGASGAVGTVGGTLGWSALYPLWFVGLFGFWLWVLLVAGACAVRAHRATAPAPVGGDAEPVHT